MIEDGDFGPGKQLPRGRHGLPRATVIESQRGRIVHSMIKGVAGRGYQETRVADVVQGAGVARKTFYDYFDDKEACFLAAYDLVSGRLYEAAAGAFNATPDARWAERITAATGALLELLAAWPEGARFAIVEVLGAGPSALVRRDAMLRRFAELVEAGRTESSIELPGMTSMAIVGGLFELLFTEILHGATARLPSRLPDVSYWITQAFLGADAADAERVRVRQAGPAG